MIRSFVVISILLTAQAPPALAEKVGTSVNGKCRWNATYWHLADKVFRLTCVGSVPILSMKLEAGQARASDWEAQRE
jgi:hypothetical protein